jgi:hypothetical protein
MFAESGAFIVTDGVASTMQQAKAMAGGRDVKLGGVPR